MKLTESQTIQFWEKGFVIIHDLLPVGVFQPLIEEFEAVIDVKAKEMYATGRLRQLYPDEPFDRRLHCLCEATDEPAELQQTVQGKRHKTAGMFKVWSSPALLDVVEQLIGPEILAHPQFNSRAKLAYQEKTVGTYHQDGALLTREADNTPMVNCWIPLVDATMENGAMQMIPGSHKWDYLPHEPRIQHKNLPPHEVVDCPVALGGVLLFQKETAHRAVPNTTDQVRWSLDLRYSDATAPTGRDYPGFIVRSRAAPETVAKDYRHWVGLFQNDSVPLQHRIK